MKKIKIIFVWTLIAIGLSFAALLFVDKVYLSSAKTFKINKVEEEDKKIKKNCFYRCARLCRKYKNILQWRIHILSH